MATDGSVPASQEALVDAERPDRPDVTCLPCSRPLTWLLSTPAAVPG
ncbi:MAG: hypothetical protein ACYC1Z_10310 [Georgenia sp.]